MKNGASVTFGASLGKFLKHLDGITDVGRERTLGRSLKAGAFAAIAYTKLAIDNSGLHRRTGNLIGSIQIDEEKIEKDRGWITYGPHTVYAAIHEFGGVIKPTNGPYLVFKTEGGDLVFTKVVHMPARPYLRPALDKHQGDIVGTIEAVMIQEIQKVWSSE